MSGYTQQQVADLTGIALQSFQRIEAGTRWPSYEYLLLLSSVLKTAFVIEEESL
ncbi:MAG: helix-turn-helix transcriptional regulator [Chitinophagaceae bacterium]|nr:helix-turn-helix transcriptional regulator [Chitinophagaceae bacterium]